MQSDKRKVIGAAWVGLATSVAAMSGYVSAFSGLSPAQAQPVSLNAARCSGLMGQQLGDATVDKTEWLISGTPVSLLNQKITTDVCRITAHISPAQDSRIKIRVWLPAVWNGKMYGFGGGGFNGSITLDGITVSGAVNKGYASVTTDAGHDVSDGAKWAFGHPEKIIDFGNRANHVGAIATKAIIASFYGSAAKRSYFHGCSNGGRDALILAQRYPTDYNAIISGAPANAWSALMSSFARNSQVSRLSQSSDMLSPKLKLVHDAALNKCDAADGVKDGLISNPSACRFDPKVLECKSGSASGCLAKPEVAAFRAIYAGTRTRDGRLIMPGFPPGSELEWVNWFTVPTGQASGMAQEYFRYMVYNDPTWDKASFVLDRDYLAARQHTAAITDAADTNLQPFFSKGGKLLMYHGWADPAIPAGNSIHYFEAARRAAGARADQMRLVMVPNMGHCGGGDGPTYVDWLSTLEQWESTNEAPNRLTATKFEDAKLAFIGMGKHVVATRPVCAWPKTPKYSGRGPANQQESYVCN